jgi:hypothetical protein
MKMVSSTLLIDQRSWLNTRDIRCCRLSQPVKICNKITIKRFYLTKFCLCLLGTDICI